MGVKNILKKVAGKAADKVSDAAVLSPKQVEEVQKKREDYLIQKPDPSDELSIAYTRRMMAASSVEIFNSYLNQIKDLYLPVEKDGEYTNDDGEVESFDSDHNIRYFNITKWVTDKNENSIEKLVNVYAVLSDENCNIALVFDRKQIETEVYLAVINLDNADNNTDISSYRDRLLEAIKGNFPGSTYKEKDENDKQYGIGILPCLDNDREYSVATASSIPAEKSEKFISQTIEKLIDGIVPDEKRKEYILILLATPIHDVEDRKLKLGEFHSGLTPYASWQTNFTYTESDAVSSGATIGVNIGASAGVQNSNSYTETVSQGKTDSINKGKSSNLTNTEGQTDSLGNTESSSDSEAETRSSSNSRNESHTDNMSEGSNMGAGIAGFSGGFNRNKGSSDSTGSSHSDTFGRTATKAMAKAMTTTTSKSISEAVSRGLTNTVGKAVTKSMAVANTVGRATNFGGNVGANFSRSSTMTAMIGKNESITQNFDNYNIKHAIELLESQMKRLEQSTALGMWDFAAYVLSDDRDVANNVAHTYLALTLGEESYLSKSAINVWRGRLGDDSVESNSAKEIVKYLRELRHPIFALKPKAYEEDMAYYVYPAIVNATTNLSGKELAYSLNFPQKSIAGLPVIKCAEFGRNVTTYDDFSRNDESIRVGKIFHMNNIENTKVDLSLNSLTSHTFITGSTGSGKSNTVYKLLSESNKKGVKFLVIEPAKGEYKNVFGNREDVQVYGTNPNIMKLLRLNPFRFVDDIHVLEHMDRLIEIFNVCWPMYAAMPAVLKSAIEKSYVDCGWDLITSVNKYGEKIYPTFKDVAYNIKDIINTSEYDDENKGAYKGSLLTRLNSLTTGINGLIFSSDDIDDERLFDENVIVDLSRVGSSETKSLIMGILVLKLQEYRMSNMKNMNSDLTHITVLEEAHNILKRTSFEQSADSANLAGKSVEMLSNAIAEMRTYGEGFIIADQAPGLMDMAAIRNTNTKIILRLPDQGDRELVGKAANLNDDQVIELAKLPRGVAAIYQNEWVQPILCKVDRFDYDEKFYEYNNSDFDDNISKQEEIENSLLDCIMDKELLNRGRNEYIRKLKKKVIDSRLETKVKCDFMELIESDDNSHIDKLQTLIFEFLKAEEAIRIAGGNTDIKAWVKDVVDNLQPDIKSYSKKQIDLAMALILSEQYERDQRYVEYYKRFAEYYSYEGGVY